MWDFVSDQMKISKNIILSRRKPLSIRALLVIEWKYGREIRCMIFLEVGYTFLLV